MRSMVEGPGAAGFNFHRLSTTLPGPSVSLNGLPPPFLSESKGRGGFSRGKPGKGIAL